MIQRLAYRLFGNLSEKIKYPRLEQKLKQSRLFIPFSMYLSLFFFFIFLIAVLGLFLEILSFALYFQTLIEEQLLLVLTQFISVSVFGSMILLFLLFLMLPELRVYDLKIKIEKQLPFAVNYMSAMAAAGVRTEIIFKTLSSRKLISIYGALSKEFSQFAVQTDFFGKDNPSALALLAEETPSPLFSNFLTGAKNTFLSGSSFRNFIVAKKQDYYSLAARRKDNYFQTLEMLSEIYITLFLAAPLFMMILLFSMMPFSGSKIEQMKLLTYQIVPFLGVVFLLILEIINEKEDV